MSRWWVRLARYAKPNWPELVAILLLTSAAVALNLLFPWPMKLIVDHVLRGQRLPEAWNWIYELPGTATTQGQIAWLAAATVLLFLGRHAAMIVQTYIQSSAGGHMSYRAAADLFCDLQKRSVSFHHRHSKGDLVRRVTVESQCVRELVLSVFLPLSTSIVTLASMFAVMWQLDRGLSIFAVVLTIPLYGLTKWLAGPMSERKYIEWECQGRISSLAEQTLTAIPVIQAFGREKETSRKFQHLAGQSVHAALRSELAQHQYHVATDTVKAVATAAVMIAGGLKVLHGELTVGSLLVLVAYFTALYSPIETMAYLSEGFASASAGARRLFEILDAVEIVPLETPRATPFATERSAGIDVEFKNVRFGYQAGKPVLNDISVQVRAGESIAIIGHTGAGKSTLISLIPRLFDPWNGSVLFNGQDIRDFQLKSLRRQIAVIPQEPFLLPLTIAENIAYGSPEAKLAEVIAAATAAQAMPFIERLPKGFDTVIGERGVTLSGGEKQRLSIARALLRDAAILVLDEPTSALDPETESAVIEALERSSHRRTTFIVAHRLSTIRRADRIIALESGQIIEQGCPEALLTRDGYYRRLVELYDGPSGPSPIPPVASASRYTASS